MEKFLIIFSLFSSLSYAEDKKYHVEDGALQENSKPEGGYTLSRVREGSASYAAGLRTGDVVEKIDGKKIVSASETNAGLQKLKTLTVPVSVTIIRDGAEKTFVVRNSHAKGK